MPPEKLKVRKSIVTYEKQLGVITDLLMGIDKLDGLMLEVNKAHLAKVVEKYPQNPMGSVAQFLLTLQRALLGSTDDYVTEPHRKTPGSKVYEDMKAAKSGVG